MGSAKLTNALLAVIAVLLCGLLLRPQPSLPSVYETLPAERKAALRPEVASRLKATYYVDVVGTVDVTGSVNVDNTVAVDVTGPVEIYR